MRFSLQRPSSSGKPGAVVIRPEWWHAGTLNRAQANVARRRECPIMPGLMDGTSLRAQLRACGKKIAAGDNWIAAICDVKTAFLRAPLDLPNKVIILRPPRVLITAQLAAEGELWIADRAIYGLQASPAAWGRHRDKELQKIEIHHDEAVYRLEQAHGDKSIWILREQNRDMLPAPLNGPPAATLGVYVDDLLACGPQPTASHVSCSG